MRVLGIDPGQSGAIAIVDDLGIRCCIDMPVVETTVSAVLVHGELDCYTNPSLGGYGPIHMAVIERVHAMPKQGVSSSFKFGRALGVLEGVVASFRWPVEMPTPAAWKKAMGVTADKDTARAKALELWPGDADLFRRKKDADRAEACLLAEWGRRLLAERSAA